jgi:hypothetical protein
VPATEIKQTFPNANVEKAAMAATFETHAMCVWSVSVRVRVHAGVSACERVRVRCVMTEWDEFKKLDYVKIYEHMEKPAVRMRAHCVRVC